MAVASGNPMSPSRRHVVGNVLALFLGSSIAQFITAVTLLLTARQLGPEKYGQYVSTVVFATFTSIVFSLGLDILLLRNAGRHPEQLGKQVGSIFAIKLAIGSIWYIVIFILAGAINLGSFPRELMRAAAFFVLCDNLYATILNSFKASLKNQYTLFLAAGSDSLWFLFSLALILRDEQNALLFMIARVAAMLISLAVGGLLIWLRFHPRPDRHTTRDLLHEAPPYAASEFLALAFLRADVLVVSLVLGQIAVGLYSPAVSLTNMIFLVQGAIYGVMTPILSNLFLNNSTQAWKTARRTIYLQSGLGVLMALGLFVSSGFLVGLLGPRFTGSLEILQILCFNVFFHSVSFALISIIVATNQQSKRAVIQAVAVTLNIVLNLLIANTLGIRGVAGVYVLTEIILLMGYGWIVLKYRSQSAKTEKQFNILIINGHSFHNAGDAALMLEAAHQLNVQFPASRITISLNNPKSSPRPVNAVGSLFTWIQNGTRWNKARLLWLLPATLIPVLFYRIFGFGWLGLTPKAIRPLLAAYIESDLVASIPGGFFYSSGKGLTLVVTSFTLTLALLAGKPLYVLPQSIGPLKRKWERLIARLLFNRARLIMVRESISKQEMEDCHVLAQKLVLVPDLGFGFEASTSSDVDDWFESLGIPTERQSCILGVTVIDWGAQNRNFSKQSEYEQAIATTVRYFVEKYSGIVLFLPQCIGPTPTEDDRIPARRTFNKIKDLSESVFLINEQPLSSLLKSIFGRLHILIGTRMHSNIFAISQNVPVIAIGYLYKTLGIAEMVGIEEWVIDIESVEGDLLIDTLDKLLSNKDAVKINLAKSMPPLIQESRMAGKLIAEDYASINNKKVAR